MPIQHDINLSGLVYNQHPTDPSLQNRNGQVTLSLNNHSHVYQLYGVSRKVNRMENGKLINRTLWDYHCDLMCDAFNTAHLQNCCDNALAELKTELKDNHEITGSLIASFKVWP